MYGYKDRGYMVLVDGHSYTVNDPENDYKVIVSGDLRATSDPIEYNWDILQAYEGTGITENDVVAHDQAVESGLVYLSCFIIPPDTLLKYYEFRVLAGWA